MPFSLAMTTPFLFVDGRDRHIIPNSALYCTSSALSPAKPPFFQSISAKSSIVGYAGNDLNTGNKRALVSAMFSSVGNAERAIKFGDIKPVGSTAVGNARVTIYTLLSGGKTDQTYRWNGSVWTHNNVDCSDETLPEGKGLWVLCTLAASETCQLQSAGEVNTTDDIVVRLNGGNKRIAIGNAFPTEIKLKDIVPEAVTEGQTIGNGRVTIYTLLSGGKTDQTYRWNGSGWTHNNADASEETFPAGKGLWVLCTVPEATTLVNLRFKNPLK